MRRCEDEKVRYRPPLLEEPCAQTLSGKIYSDTSISSYLVIATSRSPQGQQFLGSAAGGSSPFIFCLPGISWDK